MSIEDTRYTQVEDIPDALNEVQPHLNSLDNGTATPRGSYILIERLAEHLHRAFEELDAIRSMTSKYNADPKDEV